MLIVRSSNFPRMMANSVLLSVICILLAEWSNVSCGESALNVGWIRGAANKVKPVFDITKVVKPAIDKVAPAFIPRPIPVDARGKNKKYWTVETGVALSKLFPPSVEKLQKPIRQIFIDNKWIDFAKKQLPKRPVYPAVYQPPTDTPPNPFGSKIPYYSESTLKPEPHKYTPEPYIKQTDSGSIKLTERPHFTEGPQYTGRPHYTEKQTEPPHYEETTKHGGTYTSKPIPHPNIPGIPFPGNPSLGVDTFEPVSKPKLYQIIQALTLTRFIHVIDEVGLNGYLNGGAPVTVFVPSNEAFGRLPLEVIKQMVEDAEFLKKVLQYHIVAGGAHYIGNLDDSYLQLTSVAGQKLNINSHGGAIMVNGISVLKPDLPASNGVFHIINDVLYPPVTNSIWDILQEEKYSILVEIIKSSEKLTNLFKNGSPYTFFAPTNLAFSKLEPAKLKWIRENGALFAEHILGLITNGMYYSHHLQNGNSYASLSAGLSLDIGLHQGVKTVNGKPIIVSDLSAVNGVIHVVDELPIEFTLNNLLETLKANGEVVSFFLKALDKAGLIDAHLTEGGPFTVFVPSSTTFEKFDKATLKWLWDNPTKLRTLLLNHFVKGLYYFKDLHNGLSLNSVSRKPLRITTIKKTKKVNGNPIVVPNVVASNGIIHVIDGTLLNFRLHSLLKTLQDQGTHTIFLQLLNAANLRQDYLESVGPFTVFAPSDIHLSKIDNSIIKWLLKNPTKLRELILGHFVAGSYYSNVFTNGYELTAVNKLVLKITHQNGLLFVNNKQIYNKDIQATNGVINVIDGFLFDVTFGSLLEVIQGQGDKYKTFLEALENSGLIDEQYTDKGPFTIFLPTEAAFQKIDQVTLHWLLWDPENLKALVLKHFVKGVYHFDDLKPGTPLTAVGQSAQLTIGEHGGHKTVNGVSISHNDLFAKNGVIHVIDDVLFSKSLKKPA